MPEPDTLPDFSTEPFANEIYQKRLDDLAKYDTLYFFCPFADVAHQSLALGYARGGEIVPVEPPKRPTAIWNLPTQGAETLGFASFKNVEVYKRNAANVAEFDSIAPRVVSPSVVLVLESRPVLSFLVQNSMAQGGVEIPTLKGMPKDVFEKQAVNDLVFGVDRPVTAEEYRARMKVHLARAESDPSKGAQILGEIARSIIASVDRCLGYTGGVIRDTHARQDMAKTGGPDAKYGYDQRDRRALEFSGQVPREQLIEETRRAESESQKALPTIMEYLAKQQEQWMGIVQGMGATMAAQTEALKAIAAGVQPPAPAPPKSKK